MITLTKVDIYLTARFIDGHFKANFKGNCFLSVKGWSGLAGAKAIRETNVA